MKFATKSTCHCPPHLRHVATIPYATKNSTTPYFADGNRVMIACRRNVDKSVREINLLKHSPIRWLHLKLLVNAIQV